MVPAQQHAAHLFLSVQEPDPGSQTHCALREDGRETSGQTCDISPQTNVVTQKNMATKATVRFWKDDVIVTCHDDFQTPGQASGRAVVKISIRLLVLKLRLFKDTLAVPVLWAQGEGSTQVCSDPYRKLSAPAGTGRLVRMQGDSRLSIHLIYHSPVLCRVLFQFGGYAIDFIPILS